MTTPRFLDLDKLVLLAGAHPPNDGMCVLEAVAFMAGEKHSDSPKCASPVISAFMRRWNDDLPDDQRQRLKPYIPRLVNSRAAAEVESARAWLVTDWMVRVHTPAWLELGGMLEQAAALRALPVLDSAAVARAAQPTLEEARTKAAAARDAAWDAATDAATDAAWEAAWDAARDAARDAAWDAARDAARDAAWEAATDAAWEAARDAARDAAWDKGYQAAREKLRPTEQSLQQSAFELLDRMLALQDAA